MNMNAEELTKNEQRGYRLAMAWLELGETSARVRTAVVGFEVAPQPSEGERQYAKAAYLCGDWRDAYYCSLRAGCELAIKEWEVRCAGNST
jgi:hypothetical protein